jgi:hypothetical protein
VAPEVAALAGALWGKLSVSDKSCGLSSMQACLSSVVKTATSVTLPWQHGMLGTACIQAQIFTQSLCFLLCRLLLQVGAVS